MLLRYLQWGGRELPDYLLLFTPVQIHPNSGNSSAMRRMARPAAQQSLESRTLCLAPAGSCSLKHHCPRVQRCRRGAEEDSCCPCLFVAMVVPSLRTEGSIIWNFSGWRFFSILPPNCLQAAKRREKLSCITDGLQVTNIMDAREEDSIRREKG